jgi:hypothetical protein
MPKQGIHIQVLVVDAIKSAGGFRLDLGKFNDSSEVLDWSYFSRLKPRGGITSMALRAR